jgi:hypothetical protein
VVSGPERDYGASIAERPARESAWIIELGQAWYSLRYDFMLASL